MNIDISNSQLGEIPCFVIENPTERTTDILYLTADDNKLTSVSEVPSTVIKLSFNNNPTLTSLSTLPTNLSALTSLSLSNCSLLDLANLYVSSLPNIIYLDISFNYVADLSPLSSCSHLNVLVASNNRVTSCAGIPNSIINCNVSANELASLSELPIDNLIDLNVDDNESLSDISVIKNAPKLIKLSMSNVDKSVDIYNVPPSCETLVCDIEVITANCGKLPSVLNLICSNSSSASASATFYSTNRRGSDSRLISMSLPAAGYDVSDTKRSWVTISSFPYTGLYGGAPPLNRLNLVVQSIASSKLQIRIQDITNNKTILSSDKQQQQQQPQQQYIDTNGIKQSVFFNRFVNLPSDLSTFELQARTSPSSKVSSGSAIIYASSIY